MSETPQSTWESKAAVRDTNTRWRAALTSSTIAFFFFYNSELSNDAFLTVHVLQRRITR